MVDGSATRRRSRTGTVTWCFGIDEYPRAILVISGARLLSAHGHRRVRAEPRCGHSHHRPGATFCRAGFLEERLGQAPTDLASPALPYPDSLKEAFEALEAGRVQYVAADAVIGLYAAHGQGLDVSIVAMLMTPTGYCMDVSNENVDLQTAAGDVLARLVSDGTINVIERKWLGTTAALGDLTVVSDLRPCRRRRHGPGWQRLRRIGRHGSGDSGDSGDAGSEDTGSGDSSDGSDESGDTGADDNSGNEDTGDADDSGEEDATE